MVSVLIPMAHIIGWALFALALAIFAVGLSEYRRYKAHEPDLADDGQNLIGDSA